MTSTLERPSAQLRFEAMGTRCHVIVNAAADADPDSAHDLATRARTMIDDLEQRWSRFRIGSEITAMARFAGSWVGVAPSTLELVDHARLAWQLTDGRFDPTVDVARLGYDRPFGELTAAAGRRPDDPPQGFAGGLPPAGACGAIEIDHDRCALRLPDGVAFDPGGIGKGLAADRVSADLMRRGADGVLINLGGDLRVRGRASAGGPWIIEVAEPAFRSGHLARLALSDGAVATSTSLRRRWSMGSAERHHILDADTGLPTPERDIDVVVATAIASEGWWAEAAATATIGTPTTPLPDVHLLAGFADGSVERSDRFSEYER